jgi:hypothetical protein
VVVRKREEREVAGFEALDGGGASDEDDVFPCLRVAAVCDCDRARREATLRMIDQARLAGYNAICNVRYESADIAGNAATNDGRTKPLKMASCTVSGTAYVQA